MESKKVELKDNLFLEIKTILGGLLNHFLNEDEDQKSWEIKGTLKYVVGFDRDINDYYYDICCDENENVIFKLDKKIYDNNKYIDLIIHKKILKHGYEKCFNMKWNELLDVTEFGGLDAIRKELNQKD